MVCIFFSFRMSPTILLICYDERHFLLLRRYLCHTGKYPTWSLWVGLGFAQENRNTLRHPGGVSVGFISHLGQESFGFPLASCILLMPGTQELVGLSLEAALSLASWRRFFSLVLREKLWHHWVGIRGRRPSFASWFCVFSFSFFPRMAWSAL